MKRLSFIVLLFVLVTACGHKDKGFMPERLLTEQEMIDVMTDVQIIEADINFQKNQERERDPYDTTAVVAKDYVKITRSYYQQMFEHYGINDSIFTQNMRYYTERPEVLERIMDSVLQRLTAQSRRDDSQ
ncbi:MAG: DUF4296 domain-containing protein [bacterium]|jgi:hypothetical protein|nr:MAG: hypothetical protein F082_1375 [bacterium F082]KWW29252.1 MAG: hypothetical protein AUK64_1284 [bacterium P201]MDO5315221.1 DUF4296 domain-containing protein [bacterium]